MAVAENRRERLRLKIIALDRILFDDDIIQAAITTTSGNMVILKDHMPIAAIMEDAPVFIKNELEEEIIVVHGGYMSVLENEILIVADDAIFAHEIDNARVREDIRQNQEMISKGEADELSLEKAEIQLKRNLMNLKVYDLFAKRR